MIEIPTGLPAEIVPLSWLLGVWEGTGVLSYPVGDERVEREFRQRVSFSHDGQSYLNYSSQAWILGGEPAAPGVVGFADVAADADADSADVDSVDPDAADPSETVAEILPLAAETGYWRLHRPLTPGDAGPAMLPARADAPYTDAESVETLRNDAGGFDIQASIIHPDGVSELYLGQIVGPRIDLATDAVLRAAGSKDYTAATRMYGLVDNHLLWAWDIAALGQELTSHASARLAKVD
ncbi:FABP family protein [Mycetocola lacteus]|uniref:Peroxynitrite isomerase n=1 Tax=Mycetocola lacteus TaxID=76637 RepID=A0A3L7AW18_9MICO|nr:FABP family protein [Mycetocola lacteus]RLP83720.1 FABP family protein [Mycetocola lacteus]